MTCGVCGNAASGHLCTYHREQLARGLRELPALYAEVGEHLVPRRSGWGDVIPTRAAAGPCSPINEDVVDTVNWARAERLVCGWREEVRRARWPHRGAPAPAGLAQACQWLAHQVDWITAAYSAAGDLAREVWAVEQQARAVVGDPLPRPRTIGVCIAVIDDQGAICGATLTHTAGQSAITCHRCHTAYRTEQELLLLLHYQPVASQQAG